MNDQKNFKNVILDLGGVLVDLDPELTYSEFKRILKPGIEMNINWEELPDVVVGMETGNLSKEKFKSTMRKVCKPGVSDSQIVDVWCAMLLEFPAIRVSMLKELAEKYTLFLLSNTNVYHVAYFEKEFKNRYHFPLSDLFTKVYYSNEIGLRKPDAACFEHVLNDAGLVATETVMVDDRPENCEAAEKLGMHSIVVPEQTGLEMVISQLL
ncbi:MAG: HAD family hydrolase [Prolixibacteraceae bacterium]